MSESTLNQLSGLPHRSLNETIKTNLFNSVKQIKTASEFINKICLIKEHAATQLLAAVENFRKKGNEIKKECRPPVTQSCSIGSTWEALLTDTEDEARELLELSQKLVNSISVPLFDKSTKKKSFIKKVFVNRENLETQVDKTDEALTKCFKDYSDSWAKYKLYSKDPQKEQHVSTICYNCHNDYVSHLAGFNRTNEMLYQTIIPEMLTDVQSTLSDFGNFYSNLMQQFTQTHKDKLNKRLTKLQSLEDMFSSVNFNADVSHYVQSLGAGTVKIPTRSHENPELDSTTSDVLGVMLLLNPLTEPALKRKYYQMNHKASDLVNHIDKDQTAMKSLKQLRHSYIDNPAYGNPDMMCEDLLKNDFELKQKRIHLSIIAAQMNLFTKEMIQDMGPVEGSQEAEDSDNEGYSRVAEHEKAAHQFISYISRKPALCAYCKGVLIGIVKPTVRCKVCKLMAHQKCQMNVPYCNGASQPQQRPGSKLLGNRTTSMDSRAEEEDEGDYHLYSDINEPKPSSKGRRRRHSGSSAEGRAVFVNGSYGSSPSLVPSPPGIPTKPALKKKPGQCVVLYNYDANSPGDLTIKAGQRIALMNSSQDDWWEGLYKGKTGFFPASYVLKVQEKDTILKCLYDFEGEEDDELSISIGQIIVLVEDEGNGWMVGRGVDGEGIFPSTYVEKLNPAR